MSPEEAVKSALEEFKVQGYDLSGILAKHGGISTDTHPIALTTQALSSALSLLPPSGEGRSDSSSVHAALEALSQALSDPSQAAQEVRILAHKMRTLSPVMKCIQALSPLVLQQQPQPQEHLPSLLLSLSLARTLLLLSLDIRDMFDESEFKGGEMLAKLLEAHEDQDQILCAVALMAESAALKEELNKGSLVNNGYPMNALGLLQTLALRPPPPDASSLSTLLTLIRALSGSLKALVTADDDRPHVVGSAAFKNARFLAKEGKAAFSFMAVLRMKCVGEDAVTCAAVLSAIRWFAANDEICKEFLEEGGVLATLGMLQKWLQSSDVVSSALGALRQLSGSDGVKKTLAEQGGIELILSIMVTHDDEDSVLEPALALLASLMLRLPEIATQASQCGAVEGIAEVMSNRPKSHQVLRQACMAVRNMGVRNPELRPLLMERGLEDLVRQAKSAHPKQCGDVGAAALRDMGCEKYNDGDLPAWVEEAPQGGIARD